MRKTLSNFGVLLLALAAGSCTHPNVIVVDSAGSAIEGTSVQPVSLSISGSSKFTNKDGAVHIGEGGVQPTAWISASKVGYLGSGQIGFDQPKPIRVVLKKSGESGRDGRIAPATPPTPPGM